MSSHSHARISAVLRALCTLCCLAGLSGSAKAILISYIADDPLVTGGGDTVVVDQGVGDNFPGSALVGQINSGALNIGGFTIVTNISQSKPLIGSSSQPQLDLTFSAVTSDNATHTVYLYASDTGFTGGNSFLLTLGGTQPPPGGGNSITGSAWGGNSNTNLNLTNLLGSTSSLSSPFATSVGGAFSPIIDPYGLTIGVKITRSAAGTTTGDLNFRITDTPSGVPDSGSSALLMGIGVLGICGVSFSNLAKRFRTS